MRSMDCLVLINTTLPSCQSCQKARHYLRTLRRRKAVAAKKSDAKAPEKTRQYCFHWKDCSKRYIKLKLLEGHLREHTGNVHNSFLEVLLRDQATAINTEAKQMRWHPLVIRWCLHIYIKSHKLYDDLRNSGGLKLPSGRTLSDYKNFCSLESGWQTRIFAK